MNHKAAGGVKPRFRKKNSIPVYRFWEHQQKESTKELRNPACGWYQIHTFYAQQEPDLEELRWCVREEDSLVLVILHIGAYRQKPLDEDALIHMEQVLQFFHELEIDLILRVVYDNEGKGMEHEPGLFRQVLEHVDAMGPLLMRFSKRIYVFQGLLVGSWGEMHSSKFLAGEKLQALEQKLHNYLGKSCFLAVRRPMYYRSFYNDITAGHRMGLFDDGIFGSDTHLGTFGRESKNVAGWKNAWNRQEELAFEEELCRYVPNGGEAVMGEYMDYPYSLDEAVALLARMHISYLNRVHDEKVLSNWRKQQWKNKDAWKGVDGFTYIGRHLGYRFRIIRTEVALETGKEQPPVAFFSIAVRNDGFAPCYQEAEVFLKMQERVFPVDTDVRTWKSGETTAVTAKIPLGEGAVYLGLRRKSDKRIVYLANETEKDGCVLLGKFIPM